MVTKMDLQNVCLLRSKLVVTIAQHLIFVAPGTGVVCWERGRLEI